MDCWNVEYPPFQAVRTVHIMLPALFKKRTGLSGAKEGRPGNRNDSRMVALDGLRAFAVGGVLVNHYLPEDSCIQFLPWGSLGVQLFFVISGFLITGVLLDMRPGGEPAPLRHALRIFYMRRFLRIFPPYYALLLVYVAAKVSFSHGAAWACPLYVFNFLTVFVHEPFLYLGHLWTLCIEEQFYLVWPLVVLALPRRWIIPVAALLVIAAPVFRSILEIRGVPYLAIRNLPLSQFDALAGGALLAMARWDASCRPGLVVWEKCRPWIALAGFVLYLLCLKGPVSQTVQMLGATASALFMAALVDWAAHGAKGIAGNMLAFRPLVYIGKISYGIYLYQFASLFLLYKLQHLLGHPRLMNNWAGFALVWTAITILISMVSWHLFERPILQLKRRFPYHD